MEMVQERGNSSCHWYEPKPPRKVNSWKHVHLSHNKRSSAKKRSATGLFHVSAPNLCVHQNLEMETHSATVPQCHRNFFHFKIKDLSIQLLDDFQVAGQFRSSCFGRHWHLLFPAHGVNFFDPYKFFGMKRMSALNLKVIHMYLMVPNCMMMSGLISLYNDFRQQLGKKQQQQNTHR